ncbi:MAG: GLUG motif-containing protein [Planctomycetota bacterium]|jgi:hypothetical protein
MRQGFVFSILLTGIVCNVVWAVGGDMGVGTEPLTDGSEAYPWMIEDLDDFDEFSTDPNYWAAGVHTELMADIDLSGRTYTTAVIAPDLSTSPTYQGAGFSGHFDGNSHSIISLKILSNDDYFGLFGMIDRGSIQYLQIDNAYVKGGFGSYFFGIVCGKNYYGLINNCQTSGEVIGETASGYFGAISGVNTGGTLINCNSAGSMTGGTDANYFGGICGNNSEGIINNCYSGVSVQGDSSNVLGGLCGWNTYDSTIMNCYASRNVIGHNVSGRLGGLCGENKGGSILNCYATGDISGGFDLGGLCGNNYDGVINNCYASGTIYGTIADFGGLCGENRGMINNCYSTGLVQGDYDSYSLGGLCGDNYHSITNCYAIGTVEGGTASSGLGGLCGTSSTALINSCYFLETAGPDNGYGVPLNELNLMAQTNFTGWDFFGENVNGTSSFWIIKPNSYPTLFFFDNDFTEHAFDGSGTIEDPLCIYDANDLGAIWQKSNRCYVLKNDIDLQDIQWSTAVITSFQGSFDGQDNIIHNLSISGGSFLGLFGQLENDNKIENLNLENVNIYGDSGSKYLGGLCGMKYNGFITNCRVTGTLNGDSYLGGLCGSGGNISGSNSVCSISGKWYLGGLCGSSSNIINCTSNSTISGISWLGGLCGTASILENCYSITSITGNANSNGIGGLCGTNTELVQNCYASGVINCGESSVGIGGLCGSSSGNINKAYADVSVVTGDASHSLGGLCGSNSAGTIINCYSTGIISSGVASYDIGGICGTNGGRLLGAIMNCYTISSLSSGSGSYNLGGVCGYQANGTVSQSYFLDTSGPDNGYGTPLDDSNMMIQSNFTNWDFLGESTNGTNDIWRMCADDVDYPRLSWEFAQNGDFETLPVKMEWISLISKHWQSIGS